MNSKLIYTCLIISIVLMLSGCQNNTNELTYRNTKKEVTEVTNDNKTNVVDKTVNIKIGNLRKNRRKRLLLLNHHQCHLQNHVKR